MKNLKRNFVVLSVILLFVFSFAGCKSLGGRYGAGKSSTSSKVATGTQTVKVEKRDIKSVVNLSGSVTCEPEISVIPKASGKIIKVFVQEGDWVEKGDKIAEIDSTLASLNYKNAINSYRTAQVNYEIAKQTYDSDSVVTQAQANVRSAEASLNIAKLNLDIAEKTNNSDIQVKQAEEQVKQAEINLENAKNNLENLKATDTSDESIAVSQLQVKSQELSLAIAQLSLKSLKEQKPTDEDIKQAEEQINQAKLNEEIAEQRLKEAADNPNTPDEEIKILEKQVDLAKSNVKMAELNLDKLNNHGTPTDEDIEKAEDQVEQSKVALQIAEQNYAEAKKAKIAKENQIKQAENQVKLAESQLAVANDNLTMAKNNASSSSDSIEIRKAQVSQAETNLNQANVSLSDAKRQVSINNDRIKLAELQMEQAYNAVQTALENLNNYTITAPISGTILSLNIEEGDTVSVGETVAVIGNTKNFIVKAYADEIDAVNIKKGQTAILSFDAFPHKEIKGSVEYIGNTTTATSQGVQAYKVKIKINDTSISLKDGLSANLDITTQMKSNVLAVPIESVLYQNGKYYVDVVKSDNTIQRKEVETGISSDDYTEIVSGLSEGDTILRVPSNSVFTEVKGMMPGRRPSGKNGG